MRFILAVVALVALTALGVPKEEPAKMLKVGIIGLDTSHVTAFTKTLNNPKNEGDLANVRVVAAFPAGSPDIDISAKRVEGFTKTLKEQHGVEIVDSIDALLKKVDVVLLESVDGRPHLEQVKPCLRAGKPVFIDKPAAASLADAIKLYDLAAELKVPVFSSSSLRFVPGIAAAKTNEKLGDVLGCDTFGPNSPMEHHPDLFFYGIHGVEMLYAVMGPGCESVTRVRAKTADQVTGTWKDGRVGTYRGIREGKADMGATAFGTKGIVAVDTKGGYEPMLLEICKFFKTGKAPVSAAETLEVIAFMEAADESKRQGGAPVKLADVMAKARGK